MTFSIIARCAETGQLGVAITSSSQAVGSRCAYARAGVGAVVSQSTTDPRLGPRALDLLEHGLPPSGVMTRLKSSAPGFAYRQVAILDAGGRTAVSSGERTLGTFAEAVGEGVACCGNLLAKDSVPRRMRDCFLASKGEFAERLLGALRAGLDAGGESGPIHSAGLLVVEHESWPLVDLRVDWSEDDPLGALAALLERWRPQMRDYVTRALEPGDAPEFGVPGEGPRVRPAARKAKDEAPADDGDAMPEPAQALEPEASHAPASAPEAAPHPA